MSELRATYRLQLGPGLDFARARALVPYLRDLGISHLYLSPVMTAREGSNHGYDVVDPTEVSPALGGEVGLRELASAGLAVVLDVVPNHMAADDQANPFWRDPLWRVKFFDVDWRTGAHRRFFDIGELAGVRVEDPEVFDVTHRKVLELVQDRLVDGLRIDHPDGLADPARYLERLAESGAERVWVEKILAPREELRDWPVEGTTGYEFLNEVTGLFVDPAAEEPLTRLYADVTGERRDFAEVAFEAKLEQARTAFADEVDLLRAKLPTGLAASVDLERALASLHVYRTYVQPDAGAVAEADREAIARSGIDSRLAAILLLEERGHDSFVTRFQQTTPPVTAKGVEDTALYRWNRFAALNEVGGDPGRFSVSAEAFHRFNLVRCERHPNGLLAGTTHDTKRSADVRARLVALSSLPARWAEIVERSAGVVGPWRDRDEEYLLWQTLAGAWPLPPGRLVAYLEKALREAKRNTAWVDGDPDWERDFVAYATRAVSDERFRSLFEPFALEIAAAGRRIAVAQTLLRLTCPGVPDVYQGDEAELIALVDPDNRRPVDWAGLQAVLARLRAGAAPGPEEAKTYVIWKALELRARRSEAFAGAYEPLEAGGDVVAFLRGADVCVAVAIRPDVALPRLPLHGSWRDVLGALPADLGIRLLERA